MHICDLLPYFLNPLILMCINVHLDNTWITYDNIFVHLEFTKTFLHISKSTLG